MHLYEYGQLHNELRERRIEASGEQAIVDVRSLGGACPGDASQLTRSETGKDRRQYAACERERITLVLGELNLEGLAGWSARSAAGRLHQRDNLLQFRREERPDVLLIVNEPGGRTLRTAARRCVHRERKHEIT